MKGIEDKELDANEKVPESSKVLQSRRKFAKAGLITPVLMSLSSQPAWAACTLSGMLSGNLSNASSMDDCVASALSAEYWNENRNQWPDGTLSQDVNRFFNLVPEYFNGSTFEDIYNGTAQLYHGSGAGSSASTTAFANAFVELIYQAIAGVLNVYYFGDGYPFTISQIIQYVNDAYENDKAQSSTTSRARRDSKMAAKDTSTMRSVNKVMNAAQMSSTSAIISLKKEIERANNQNNGR